MLLYWKEKQKKIGWFLWTCSWSSGRGRSVHHWEELHWERLTNCRFAETIRSGYDIIRSWHPYSHCLWPLNAYWLGGRTKEVGNRVPLRRVVMLERKVSPLAFAFQHFQFERNFEITSIGLKNYTFSFYSSGNDLQNKEFRLRNVEKKGESVGTSTCGGFNRWVTWWTSTAWAETRIGQMPVRL